MAASTRIDETSVDLAWKSYGRWSLNPEFYNEFYDTFFAAIPAEMRQKFAHTDMEKQKDLLRRGISLMLMFLKGSPAGEMAFTRIAVIHDDRHQDIRPEHYSFWKNAFLDTIGNYDREYTKPVRDAWARVVDAAFAFFLERHKTK